MRTMIIGAGIGVLTAAIALRQAGLEVAIFERTAELREIGAGLVLSANARKALGKLGLPARSSVRARQPPPSSYVPGEERCS